MLGLLSMIKLAPISIRAVEFLVKIIALFGPVV
jgi:hypothetical protein